LEEDRQIILQLVAERKSVSRNTGLSAGKRILENLGLLSPRSFAVEGPVSGPLSPSPLSPVTASGIEPKNGTKKRSFSFRLRSLAGGPKKEEIPRTTEARPLIEENAEAEAGPSSQEARPALDQSEPSASSQPQH
jgi:hypothetical protein